MLQRKQLEDLFDRELYINSYENYSQLLNELQKLEINTEEEAILILTFLKKNASLAKQEYVFNPIGSLLKLINYNSRKLALNLYKEEAVTVFKEIYSYLDKTNKGLLLQSLYVINSKESVYFFIDMLTDQHETELETAEMYKAVKAFEDAEVGLAELLAEKLVKVFEFDDFRTVAVLELFNSYVFDKKITIHPIAKHLSVIEKWLQNVDNHYTFSYAVSGCVALSLIDSKEALQLLDMAVTHPNLEIRLEAVFAQIIHNISGAKDRLIALLKDPRISDKAIQYVLELNKNHGLVINIPKNIQALVAHDWDFIAQSTMCSWLSHEREYGYHPDSIEIWDKRKIYWPPAQEIKLIYLLKYCYCNRQLNIPNREEIGYFIPFNEYDYTRGGDTFSVFKEFTAKEAAYAAYCQFNMNCKITEEEALQLIKKYNPQLSSNVY